VNHQQTRRSGLKRRHAAGLVILGAVAALGVAGCSSETISDIAFVGLPEPASEEAGIVKSFWDGAWIAAWAVGIFVWGLMIWSFIAYRRRKNDTRMPEQTRYNIPIEVLYTFAPLIMVFGIFAFALRDQSDLMALSDDYDNNVQVVGFRWSWTFNYLDDDAYEVGTPQEFPTLWLPVDEKVRFELNSPDVVHSFWVPQWLFKLDVIPGQTNEFEVTPNQIGEFAGKCAELCGVDHSRMLFKVKVVTRAEYEAHIKELKAAGQSGRLETALVNSEGDDVRSN
jgi:cytochrome c oxidase subunit 2